MNHEAYAMAVDELLGAIRIYFRYQNAENQKKLYACMDAVIKLRETNRNSSKKKGVQE